MLAASTLSDMELQSFGGDSFATATNMLAASTLSGKDLQSFSGDSFKTLTFTPSVSSFRAVSASVVLMRLGYLWKSSETCQDAQQLWNVTLAYDAFLSHSWAAGRFGKLLALALFFNVNFALVAGMLLGVLVAILQRQNALPLLTGFSYFMVDGRIESVPDNCWAKLIGVMLTTIILLYGQHPLNCTFTQWRLFLDKLCIEQSDDQAKREGIESLAAFLKSSDRLVVLWSQQYFSRLWCVFELASWVHLRKPPIVFLPLVTAKMVISCMCYVSASLIAINFLVVFAESFDADQPREVGVVPVLAICVGFSPACVTWVLSFRPYMRERRELLRQLKSFDCEAAGCFSSLDRERILRTIDVWYREESSNDPRKAFNTSVHTLVHDQVLQSIGHEAWLPYSWSLVACLPMWWSACDFFGGTVNLPVRYQINILVSSIYTFFFTGPLLILASLRIVRMATDAGYFCTIILCVLLFLGTLSVFFLYIIFHFSGGVAGGFISTVISGLITWQAYSSGYGRRN